MTTQATYSIEASWENYVTGIFTLDSSLLDGTDVLAADFGATAYDDMTDEVKGVEIHRGRSGDFGAMDAGTCRIVLDDPDGRYNPSNAGALTNLLTNPSFETNKTGWTAVDDGTGEYFQLDSRAAYFGVYGLLWVMGTSPAATPYMYHDWNTAPTQGVAYTFSIYIKGNAGANGSTIRLRIYEKGGAAAQQTTYKDNTLTTSWQRFSVTHTIIQPDRTALQLIIGITSGAAKDDAYYMDGFQLETASSASAYCDGDQDNCRWSGTAHASTSYRGGPLYGKLLPLRPIRIQATGGTARDENGMPYARGLFSGYITRIEHNPHPDVQETVIEAVDMFERLKRARVSVSTMTSELVSAIISQILENCQIPLEDTDVGTSTHTVPSYAADGSTDMLSEIQDLLQIDQGVFFISGDGRATYVPHGDWYDTGAAVATFDGTLASTMISGISVDGIVNKQTVTRTGGSAQTSTDNDSVDAYGYCVGAPIESTYMVDDAQALALAGFITGIYAEPRPPARKVAMINADATSLEQILGRELGDIVTVSETRSSTSITGPIEAIHHRIHKGGVVHQAEFVIRERPASVPSY